MRTAPRLPADNAKELALTLKNLKLGVLTLLKENRTPPQAVVRATNLMQIQDGVWAPKWGASYYSIAGSANIDGADECVNPDGSVEILEVINGTIYRSSDGGTKTAVTLTGGTLTPGKRCFFKQIRGFVYITNSFDAPVRYNNATKTAAGYAGLATPVAATLAKTGLTGSTYNAYYVIVATNDVGMTVGSPEAVIQVGKLRDEWAGSTLPNTSDFVTLTLTRVTNAKRYSIFYSDQSGFEVFLASVADPGTGTTFTFVDDGTIAPNEFVELPNDNTTTGPPFGLMELSGSRLWATGDPNNPWRVYFAGVGQFTGSFSAYYGGGYVDLDLGGRERPTAVQHYRDGKGSAAATVWTTDPEGNGSVWQITLETVTVGSTSFIVPSTNKIVGSIGATGPRAVVKVGDDIMFGNAKGAYSLGSQPSLLNVLSTTEVSANIRPSWRNLTTRAMKDAAAYYYDAKVFWSVPNLTNGNSEIWIRSTELRNWQLAWTGVAIASFFEHVDAGGKVHLLGVPVSGTQLIELSPDNVGDFGQPFVTKLRTGIIPVDADHNKFAQITDMFGEVGSPVGSLRIDAYGYDYQKEFIFLGSLTITGGSRSNVHWGARWSTRQWSHVPASEIPVITSPSVERRRKRINRLVNNLQFEVTTTDVRDYYELLELEATGFLVPVAPPPKWKIGSNAPSIGRVQADTITDDTGAAITDDNGNPLLL